MTLNIATRTAAESFLNKHCRNIRLKYYVETYTDNNYDDQTTVAQSGADIWTKGYVEPLISSSGGEEQTLDIAGAITTNDSKLYIAGSLTTDLDVWTKIGVGSPSQSEYSMIEKGDTIHYINETPIYDLIFIRKLNTGSFIGEV